ncbi:hypothetical protein THAOC_06478 [Thalassiosira oceanica]|uniref:Phosphoribulokinase/uridine kinase domain-containing protein n=1 Tax=Thalassiosira oceanica TaxID=159749 RepID=K0T2Q1_THAOC|nr:hypothetical protein THAOC_06478 [Thalassiosira oceanica]|eukprot:EJK72030.1 hypothetical protein THAOC_06478 [Thalassiosira oceanica]
MQRILLVFALCPAILHAFTNMKTTPAKVDDKMMSTYDRLASRLVGRYAKESECLQNNQLFVCVSGGPGGQRSGKSTLSEAVSSRINELLRDESASVVLPMDGYHYTRAQLKAMGDSDDCPYSNEDLIARRGAPWTFDAEACVRDFTRARELGQASLPIYSRTKSDPIEDGALLSKDTKIVLLEGNYLLAWGDERWRPLQTNRVFDETWYIACRSLDDQRERLVKRHLETWSVEKTRMFGEGEVGAGVKADSNDMLNLVWIDDMSRKHADLIIDSE